MEQVIEAVYKSGVLTPLQPLDLPEHQRVIITIQVPVPENAEATLASSVSLDRPGALGGVQRKNETHAGHISSADHRYAASPGDHSR